MRNLCVLALSIAGLALAQDSPVTVGAGSPLTISLAPAEQDWVPQGGNRINHPLPGHTVTRVEVKYADGSSVQPPVAFTNQQCEVSLTYGGLTVTAITNPNGKNLRVLTSGTFSGDYTHPNGRVFVSKDQKSSVSALSIKRAGQAVSGVSLKPGHIEVVIHYE